MLASVTIMTRIVATVLTAPLALGGVTFAAPPAAQAARHGSLEDAVAGPEPGDESPQALYKAGKAAYRLSHYEEAVDKWERSYAASGNALLLYNIGLAYKEWYSVSQDVNHLRKAKAVFQNYAREAARNPDMDQAEAENQATAQITEIDKILAKIEEEEAKKAADNANRPQAEGPAKEAYKPTGPDPGKKLRLAGIGTMAGGGAAFLTGVVMGVIFGLKGQEFSSELNRIYGQQEDEGCNDDDSSQTCQDLSEAERVTRENGNSANLLTVISFAAIGGIGAAALVTGGLLYAKGNKKTEAWRKGPGVRLRLLPAPNGLVLSGRF